MATTFMSETVVSRNIRIASPAGLHARPAELFAKKALSFAAQIEIIKGDQRVDAKSILHILTLGATQGTELVIQARGVDAEQALEALVELVNSDFAADQTQNQES